MMTCVQCVSYRASLFHRCVSYRASLFLKMASMPSTVICVVFMAFTGNLTWKLGNVTWKPSHMIYQTIQVSKSSFVCTLASSLELNKRTVGMQERRLGDCIDIDTDIHKDQG